jgi:hypothetical protein
MVNRVKKMGRITGGIRDGARTLIGNRLINDANSKLRSKVQSYAVGGTVKRTGLARLHKGELVITAAAHKALKKIMKK